MTSDRKEKLTDVLQAEEGQGYAWGGGGLLTILLIVLLVILIF